MNIFSAIISPVFLRFCVVGSVGTGVNISTYSVLTLVLHASAIVSSCVAFFIAVTENYCLNAVWTFGSTRQASRLGFGQFVAYVLANLAGLLVNLAVLSLTIRLAGANYHLVGQLFGILCGMVFNYRIAKHIVFKARPSATSPGNVPATK